jgi:hypothetical protein
MNNFYFLGALIVEKNSLVFLKKRAQFAEENTALADKKIDKKE